MRRAWIEIAANSVATNIPSRVALHAEGVDRNKNAVNASALKLKSPSMRRAWIEIRLALQLWPNG